jgi:hypothetical protein
VTRLARPIHSYGSVVEVTRSGNLPRTVTWGTTRWTLQPLDDRPIEPSSDWRLAW